MSLIAAKTALNIFLANSKNVARVTFCRNYPAPRKRFYRSVHISGSDGRFEISLDKRKLKTPLGTLLQLPSEALAVAVATEWELQQDVLQQHNMHITALCNTALDNPCQQTKETIVDNMVQYLESDTLCFRSSEPPELAALQKDHWDPVLAWFQNRYHVKIDVCQDVSSIPVSEETINQIKKQLLSYNYWCLLGISFATENLKSLILTMAAINHIMDVETAVDLSRLETLFQVKHWGNVEWSHDVDKAQTTARVAAGTLFTYLNAGSTGIVEKDLSGKAQFYQKAEASVK